jgi:hypothetical protein
VLAAALLGGAPAGARELPVFLADDHAETFGWIARTFDPDDPHVLVLVDAHSDASAAERSEDLREGVRRVPDRETRGERIEAWRREGRIQAFNWIEPLMPRPVDRVRWLAAPELSAAEKHARTAEAAAQLDGRVEVEPRSAGSFAGRWETMDGNDLARWRPGAEAVILAIDLDFFAGMEPPAREAHFSAIWEAAMDWPGLRGVAVAVSRPWLTDDAEADALVRLAVDAVRRTRGARLELDAAVREARDLSRRAEAYRIRGEEIPRWRLSHRPPGVLAALAGLGSRLSVHAAGKPRPDLPARWHAAAGVAELRPEAGEIDCDGVWRLPLGAEPALRVHAPPGATGRVRWFALEPARAAYDLLPDTGLGKDFSQAPGRWIFEKRRLLGVTTDFLLGPQAWRGDRGGRVRIEAEYESTQGWLPVAPLELRVRTAEGFRGALSECLGMPYAFGIAAMAEGDLSGVETGWGADCSNVLIHAWRRNGHALSWGDPGRLRAQLATKAEGLRPDSAAAITTAEIEQGIAIDFGRHVAAVWEDRPPRGVLDAGDRVFHHLGGWPEIVSLAELAAGRPAFALRVPRPSAGGLRFAGDVVLAGEDRVVIDGFTRGPAGLFLVNLEGIPTALPPRAGIRHDFRFPPERLDWLKRQGVDGVSLANNHAWDAGEAGFLDGLLALEKAGIPYFGGGRSIAAACRPWRCAKGGVRLAVFGLSLHPRPDECDPAAPGIAHFPAHRERLEIEFARCRAAGERIVVLVHGGDEYRAEVNDAQRQLARWLAACGASIVAGSGPHVVQRDEIHGGTTVLHSLGNAVYPRSLKGADSGRIATVEIR